MRCMVNSRAFDVGLRPLIRSNGQADAEFNVPRIAREFRRRAPKTAAKRINEPRTTPTGDQRLSFQDPLRGALWTFVRPKGGRVLWQQNRGACAVVRPNRARRLLRPQLGTAGGHCARRPKSCRRVPRSRISWSAFRCAEVATRSTFRSPRGSCYSKCRGSGGAVSCSMVAISGPASRGG